MGSKLNVGKISLIQFQYSASDSELTSAHVAGVKYLFWFLKYSFWLIFLSKATRIKLSKRKNNGETLRQGNCLPLVSRSIKLFYDVSHSKSTFSDKAFGRQLWASFQVGWRNLLFLWPILKERSEGYPCLLFLHLILFTVNLLLCMFSQGCSFRYGSC